jgi:hypothetical protein
MHSYTSKYTTHKYRALALVLACDQSLTALRKDKQLFSAHISTSCLCDTQKQGVHIGCNNSSTVPATVLQCLEVDLAVLQAVELLRYCHYCYFCCVRH